MALVRIIAGLLRDKQFGKHLIPIVADEARTFGMQTLFHQIGIYSPHGQTYEPEDAGSLVSYKEAKDGQLLEEGISEAGAISGPLPPQHIQLIISSCCPCTFTTRCSASNVSET